MRTIHDIFKELKIPLITYEDICDNPDLEILVKDWYKFNNLHAYTPKCDLETERLIEKMIIREMTGDGEFIENIINKLK